MRREDDFRPVNRRQKIIYIYKEFGLAYLVKTYYKYAARIVLAIIYSSFRRLLIFTGIKKYQKLKIKLTNNPTQKVSIIIPFKDTPEVLNVCVNSILQKTEYQNYEIILVNNQSILPETKDLIASLLKNQIVSIFNFDEPFNFAKIHNVVIDTLQTDLVLMLNNDTEVISPNWLGHMVDVIENNDNVGAVGPLLLFHNNTIQHAGISLGVRYGLPYHIYESLPFFDASSLPQEVNTIREVSALTGACLLTRKSLYQKLGGFNDQDLKVAFNDIDFCLEIYKHGMHNIFTPNVCLYHYESYTRGLDYLDRQKSLRLARESLHFMKKWSKYKVDIFTGFDTRCEIDK